MPKEKLTLVKEDGTRIEDILGTITPECIVITDVSLPIQAGDKLFRTLPNAMIDAYLVLDSGYVPAMVVIEHFEVKYRKISALDIPPPPLAKVKGDYVAQERIEELRAIQSTAFDLSRLIGFCIELNKCYANECYFAVAMLVRAIIDHVPPVFGYDNFTGVINNVSMGKSSKDAMRNLQESLRKLGDSYLHSHIQSKEPLPNGTSVNFAASLDMLLVEIVRRMSTPS